MRIILLILLALGIFAAWYLARRSAFVFGTRAGWWYVGYGLVMFFSLASMVVGGMPWSAAPVVRLLVMCGGVCVGFLIYLFISTLLTDLVRLLVPMRPWLFGTIAVSLALGMSIVTMAVAASPRMVEQTVALPKLERPMRVVQLTDTHFGFYRGEAHMRHLVEMVNAARPDLVLFTGDCFDSWYRFSVETVAPLRELEAPIYFVAGNHEGYLDAAMAKRLLREAGVRVLENEVVCEKGLCIVGLDFMAQDTVNAGHHAPRRPETIENTLPKLPIDRTKPVIALHHSPVGADYMEAAGVDLLLSGHTHGGQLWPLTWVNNRLFPFNRGLDRHGRMQVYVSVGSGTFGPPMRLGTVSEVTLLQLVPAVKEWK